MTPNELAQRTLERRKQREKNFLIDAIALESRGEGIAGMALVARSILNRSKFIKQRKDYHGRKMYGNEYLTKGSSNIIDILRAKNQYQVVDKNGNLKYSTEFPLTEEDRLNAKSALELAQNDEKYFATLVDSGIDFPMEEVFNVTGFRRFDSFYDPSQDVGTFKIGNHVFNTASVPKGTPRPITKR